MNNSPAPNLKACLAHSTVFRLVSSLPRSIITFPSFESIEITDTYLNSKMTTIIRAYTADLAMKQFVLLNKGTTIIGIKQVKGES